MNAPILSLKDLRVYFPIRRGFPLPRQRNKMVRAVDGVSFEVHTGEILAMVGESGCGKTTVGKALSRLVHLTGGSIHYKGEDISRLAGSRMRELRRQIQLIFQDPYESLNPRQSVYDIVVEPLHIHHASLPKSEKEARVYQALEATGLFPSEEIARRFPHHLSGGQRQRVAIAAAMILEPEFVVTDEPVSMLDVSIRAEILKLMLDLKANKNLTYLFITHDLSLAWVIANRILVLYLGRVMELGEANEVIHQSMHPYTQALVSVIPLPKPKIGRKQIVLEGETPSPLDIPTGCRFRPRCWLWRKLDQPSDCVSIEPEFREVNQSHWSACHFSQHLP